MNNTGHQQPDRVLHRDDVKLSTNFFDSDKMLQDYIRKYIPEKSRKYMMPKWHKTGERAAREMDELSLLADQNEPELIKRNKWGEEINEIRFHPAYWQLMDFAVESEMMRIKWDPDCRRHFRGERNTLSFISGFIYSLSEMGQYCPLCMTDGAALLLDRYADEETRARLMPGFAASDGRSLTTGAMYLTEKSGGSDVGANLVEAHHETGSWYRLYGEKWFCSNANNDVAMVLARTDPEKPGTRGLSLFLVEPKLPDGSVNPVDVVRLKEKMGVRSMASAECRFDGTWAWLIGEEFDGFKMMTDMINLSRLYNSVVGIAGTRRALIEAYQFLINRRSFGEEMLNHSLIREKLNELGALHVANFLLVWRTVRAMDAAENGDEQEAERLRLLIPMAKWWSAEFSVYVAREAMELMGGIGYIEDQVMPKLFRDVNVLPIWEGSGNIIVLDMLRAMKKSDGMKYLKEEINSLVENRDVPDDLKQLKDKILRELDDLADMPQDEREASAKPTFMRLIHLYQALLMKQEDEDWADLAFQWYQQRVLQPTSGRITPAGRDEIEKIMAWII